MSHDFDYLIRNATVFDGVSAIPQYLSVGTRGDQIAYVGPPLTAASARRVIDAVGLYLCPGFIDTHASTGLGYRFPHAGDHKLFQGVTTEIVGNCGTSTGPISDRLVPTMRSLAHDIGFTFDWRTLDEWFRRVTTHGLPFNVGTFAGHSTLRGGVCGDQENITESEIERMQALLDQAMTDGAFGLSTGLVYSPGSFAETPELIALADVAARHGGLYVSHIRDERQALEEAIEEAIEIGRSAGLAVLISHLKAAERPNWGKVPAAIRRIEEARESGLEVTFEVYPYTATSTKLRTFIPKAMMAGGVDGMVEELSSEASREQAVAWLHERGTDFERMVMLTGGSLGEAGESVEQIARSTDRDPAETAVDLLLDDPDAWIIYDCIDPDDMDAAILWPQSIICSDSWSHPVNVPNQIGDPHPRTFGAFTRFLERYALSEPRIPFGNAVRKITSYPAEALGLESRGRIAEGGFADLVLLDPTRVRERATYTDPRQLSDGTDFVWVNGTLMLEKGQLMPKLPGQVLRSSQ